MKFCRVINDTYEKVNMHEYLRDKVFTYCNKQVEKGVEFSLYDVEKELNTLFYIYATMLYGEWINSQSDFVGVEFSKGSFEMVEYQTEKDV